MVDLKPIQPTEAIRAFEARKPELRGAYSYLDFWQDEHATMFTVAKSAGFDILNDISEAFERALKEGKTPQWFARNLQPVLQAKGWWGKKMVEDPDTGEMVPAQLGSARRLERIFDTNMRVSYAAGHWAAFEQNKRGRPFLRYVTMRDDHVRPQHARRHNLVLPVDHPYWNEWAPPCGWGCRCTLQSLSQRDIDRLIAEGENLFFEPPENTWRNFTNRRTGEITRVPDGIDPGWAYNPGRAGYEARVAQAFAEKIADAKPEFVAAGVEERIASSAFERFFVDPRGSMPVAAIAETFAPAIGADVRAAIIEADAMVRQRQRFPDLTIQDYRSLLSIGTDPTLILQDPERSFILQQVADGRWRYVALQVNPKTRIAFVTSFHYVREETVQRILKNEAVRILLDRRNR